MKRMTVGAMGVMNGRPIPHDRGHATMDALLDVWIGRQPVSPDLKQAPR